MKNISAYDILCNWSINFPMHVSEKLASGATYVDFLFLHKKLATSRNKLAHTMADNSALDRHGYQAEVSSSVTAVMVSHFV